AGLPRHAVPLLPVVVFRPVRDVRVPTRAHAVRPPQLRVSLRRCARPLLAQPVGGRLAVALKRWMQTLMSIGCPSMQSADCADELRQLFALPPLCGLPLLCGLLLPSCAPQPCALL